MPERKTLGVQRTARLGLVVALLALARGAHAGPREDADAALHRGVALRREGKDAEALEAFQRALALAPNARARAQVALAEQALALWVAAERDLGLALADKDDPWIKQNHEVLEAAAKVVASKLAWATVRANVPYREIRVNGSPAAVTADGRVRVVAGLVTVEARADGYEPGSSSLQIAPETTATVRVVLAPIARPSEPTPTPSPEPSATSSDGGQRTAGFIVTGVGVVGIGIGAAFGLRAISKKDERDADCMGGCSQIGVDADRAGRTAGLISTIATLGGVAAAGVGLWLILDSRSAPPRKNGRLEVGMIGSFVSMSGSF